MRDVLIAILLLAAPPGASDLTWDFTEDTTWGWAAQESFLVRESSAAVPTGSSEITASSVRLTSPDSQPSVATITGAIRGPRSREITFSYLPPTAIESSKQRVALDSLDRFAFELPVVRGTRVRGHYDHNSLDLFVEPGDSLHVIVEEGFSGPSYTFSGSNADNSRFIAEWTSPFRLDYKDLEVEDFKRQVEQRRRDQFEFLDEGRKKYALSPGFIDYATADVNYEWARLMISYPTNYYFANGRENREIPPEYYDFLQEIPLVDEKAIGTMEYSIFLERTLDWEYWKDWKIFESRFPKLSERYDLSSLELSEETQAQLDALYEKDGRQPVLSKMVDLSGFGVSESAQAQLDALYEKDGRWLKPSERYDLSGFGVSESAQAQLDSLYEKSGRSFRITSLSEGETPRADLVFRPFRIASLSEGETPRADTTGGKFVFYVPRGVRLDSLAKEPPKLSAKLDLSDLGLSDVAQAQLDSMYEHRQPLLKLSAKLDLSGLGLSEAAQAQLDSIYITDRRHYFGPIYNVIKEKLEGRVLYWYLARYLIHKVKINESEGLAWVQSKWEEFQQINPHPEYTEAVQAALDEALKLQPGQSAPNFTLDDLDGKPVSLSQFKGQVVLLDFWASWCGPCIGDLPHLRKIKEKTAALPVVFVNLSLDEDEAAWREAIDKHAIEGVHVRAGSGSDVAKSYQVMGIPSYYLVDPQGFIVKSLSIWDTDAIVAMIEESL